MDSLDRDFGELVERLADPGTTMAGGGDPFYYLVHDPAHALEVRERLPAWIGRLRNAGWEVERVSFADLLWELIDRSGRWDDWLEAEADADPEEVADAISDVVTRQQALIERVGAIVGQNRPRTVILFTETEVLHPYFRVGLLENRLHDRVRTPTVVLYPGRRVGQSSLRFLDLYDQLSHYRATTIGGLP